MTLSDEVRKVLEDNHTTPLYAYEKVRELLTQACLENGRCNPLGPEITSKEGRDGYHNAHNWFKEKGLYSASEKLLLEWWNDFGVRQIQAKKRVYRAEIAYLLADLYWEAGDKGTAFRWAMHMQADDILGEHKDGGGAGKQTLTTKFGMSTPAFEKLNCIAQECLEEVKQSDDWARVEGFPEEVISRFAESDAGYSLAEASSSREFPVSKGYYQALLNRADSAKTNDEKGKTLEDLAFYLMLLLPGCVPRKNMLAEKRIFESDIVVHNLSPSPNLTTDLLGRHFLIECKNKENEKANVADVGYFLYRMKLTHTKFGIIFSRNDITGMKRDEAGYELVRRAYHEDDSLCVVIKNDDLEKLKTGKETYFWWMLLGKIEELRFGKPKSRKKQN
ncbi:MAG: hypothetical protein GY797_02175 [Deltaproteobacteria bacterium]|nr:hypothetical protein [Deltaproteobacteria bacterium]